MMKITLNGDPYKFEAPAQYEATIAGLTAALSLDPRKVAVERNLAIVPKSAYGETPVDEGDRIEIVHFVGGG